MVSYECVSWNSRIRIHELRESSVSMVKGLRIYNTPRRRVMHTGSHSLLLKVRSATSIPVVIALIDPVIAIALTFFPYLLADFNSSRALQQTNIHTSAQFQLAQSLIYCLTQEHLPINIRFQKMLLEIHISRIIQQRRSRMRHIIKIIISERSVPCSCNGVVRYRYEGEMRCPFWVRGEDLGAFAG